MFVLPLTHRVSRRASTARALDRLFDESFDRFLGATTSRTPAIDVVESDTAYTLLVDVPGVTKDQLQVTVEGQRVSIETAEQAAAEGKDGERVLYRERSAVRFARTVVLPAEVDQAASQAKVDNGVLTLTLAKKVPTGAQRISVN
jgi:HSP20 family protein